MPRKKQLIIPVFMPSAGCPAICVFCSQKDITGAHGLPSIEDITATVNAYLSTWSGNGIRELAFYGGTFTGLPRDSQEKYLNLAAGLVAMGRVQRIRVSTRPDYVSPEIAALLGAYGVTTVELGVQSMSDEVLLLSKRGHTSGHTEEAVGILKQAGIGVGAQIMPGLPGDTFETITGTARQIVKLAPDFVRIYPCLVLKNTELHEMHLRGEFKPWGIDDMLGVCKEVYGLFKDAGIPVIRWGLQDTEALRESLVAGPYHPSFRQAVENSIRRA